MKRNLSIVALLLASCALFGQVELSAGFGGGFTLNKETGKYTLGSSWLKEIVSVSALELELFLDAEYAAISVGYSRNFSDAGLALSNSSGADASYDAEVAVASSLFVAAFAMSPFKLGIGEIYPMAGAEYRFNLSYEDEDGTDLKILMSDDLRKGLDELWLEAGIGLDYPSMRKGTYFRSRVMAGYKLPTSIDEARKKNEIAALAADGGETAVWRITAGLYLGFEI